MGEWQEVNVIYAYYRQRSKGRRSLRTKIWRLIVLDAFSGRLREEKEAMTWYIPSIDDEAEDMPCSSFPIIQLNTLQVIINTLSKGQRGDGACNRAGAWRRDD